MIEKHLHSLPDFELKELLQSQDVRVAMEAHAEVERRRRMAGGPELIFGEPRTKHPDEEAVSDDGDEVR